MRTIVWPLSVCFLILFSEINAPACRAEKSIESKSIHLEIAQFPSSGLVMLPLSEVSDVEFSDCRDLAWGMCENWEGKFPVQLISLKSGCFAVFQVPRELTERSRKEILKFAINLEPGSRIPAESRDEIVIQTPAFSMVLNICRNGGFPSRLTFSSNRETESITWGDRLFAVPDSETPGFSGVWSLTEDPSPRLELIADGLFCTVVRQTARYYRGGSAPPSEPGAVYDWVFFKNAEGLIAVQAVLCQKSPFSWKEAHVGELHVNDASFPFWGGTDRVFNAKKQNSGCFLTEKNDLSEEKVRINFDCAAGLFDGENLIAQYAPNVLFYGNPSGRRIYLHARADNAWKGWETRQSEPCSFILKVLSLGKNVQNDAKDIGENIGKSGFPELEPVRLLPGYFRWTSENSSWEDVIAEAEKTPLWRLADSQKDSALLETRLLRNADLAVVLALYGAKDGTKSLSLNALADVKADFVLTRTPQELFTLEVESAPKAAEDGTEKRGRKTERNVEQKSRKYLTSRSSWRKIEWDGNFITFTGPAELPEAPELQVRVKADPSAVISDKPETLSMPTFSFGISVATKTESVRPLNVSVGRILIENTGPGMKAVHPGGCGTIVEAPADNGTAYRGVYPSMNAVMPWMAFWDKERGTGLYLACLDPNGSAKNVLLQNPQETSKMLMEASQPLPLETGNVGAETFFAGEVVWQRLDGDWYSAASRYRDWVRRFASWYPKMGPEGRVSEPLWMKRLCVWGRVFGEASAAVPQAVKFRETLGIPVGIHWYHWHEIPFDNDYPHYLPAKAGFAEGVKEMQKNGCRVVPYLNGRLWDTRDRENEDFEFSAVGLAGAAKKNDGTPFLETYQSREKDGSKVVLAVMCPGSNVWKKTLAETSCRLINEYGLDGVYLDQIACAAPVLCEDPTHGHSLRGGSWWANEYRKLLTFLREEVERGRKNEERRFDAPIENQEGESVTADDAVKRFVKKTNSEIQRLADLPKDFILSSESNVETCANDIDGMVCWHIEGKNVPAWHVVYSGAVFPYGRAYDGNSRAMRMKWANNLVCGDSPGWFPPEFIQKPELGPYLRQLARFRFHSIEYFYLGELQRAPKLLAGDIPEWSENWNIFGRYSINATPVVQTAARRIQNYQYDENGNRLWDTGKTERVLLIFTNYSFEDAVSRIEVDWSDLGLNPERCEYFHVDSEGRKKRTTFEELRLPLLFSAGETWGVEIVSDAERNGSGCGGE